MNNIAAPAANSTYGLDIKRARAEQSYKPFVFPADLILPVDKGYRLICFSGRLVKQSLPETNTQNKTNLVV